MRRTHTFLVHYFIRKNQQMLFDNLLPYIETSNFIYLIKMDFCHNFASAGSDKRLLSVLKKGLEKYRFRFFLPLFFTLLLLPHLWVFFSRKVDELRLINVVRSDLCVIWAINKSWEKNHDTQSYQFFMIFSFRHFFRRVFLSNANTKCVFKLSLNWNEIAGELFFCN